MPVENLASLELAHGYALKKNLLELEIRNFTNLDRSRHHVYDWPMSYNYVVLLI